MKKLGIVAVLLATGVFVASGLFAQEIKFDGYVNTGLGVVLSTEKDAPDPYIAAYGMDAGGVNGFRFRLHATYTNEAGNAGANARFQAATNNGVTIPWAYGWFSAFNNILTVKGGLVDDGTWNTGGAYFDADMGEGLGALARITPVSGLDIGLGAYLAEVGITPSAGNSPAEGGGTNNFAHEFDQAKYTFSFGYTLPDLVKIVASFRPKSEAGANGDKLPSRLNAGVSLLAVPNLKAVLEVQLDNLQDFKAMKVNDKTAWNTDDTPDLVGNAIDSSGKFSFFETVQYDMGSLSVGLWAAEWLSQAEDTDLGLYVNPWVSYALGSIVPRLDLGYGTGARHGLNTANNSVVQWNRTGNYGPTYNSDISVISIRPSVKFNIDPKTFVEIGDLINVDGGPKGTWASDPDAESRISNVFYVELKWAF